MCQDYAESLSLGSYGNVVPTRTFTDAFFVSSIVPKAETINFSVKGQLVNISGFAGYVASLCNLF